MADQYGVIEPSPYADGYLLASHLAGLPIPERRWLVPNLIPGRQVTMIGGDGGTGKSLLALQLAVALATGTQWIGRAVAPGQTLYVGSEDELDELHRRLAGICEAEGVDLADLDGVALLPLAGQDATLAEAGRARVEPTTGWTDLIEIIKPDPPALVILDNLADVYAASEIDRPMVRSFVQMLRGLAMEYDLGLVMLAHPSVAGMANGSGYSGSTGWNNSVRSRLYLDRVKADGEEPDPRRRVLRHKKSNYGPGGGEISLRWTEGRYVAEGGIDRMAASARAERLFLSLLDEFAAIGRHVNEARTGPNYAPKAFAQHDGNEGVTKKEFERAMEKLLFARTIELAEIKRANRHSATVLQRVK